MPLVLKFEYIIWMGLGVPVSSYAVDFWVKYDIYPNHQVPHAMVVWYINNTKNACMCLCVANYSIHVPGWLENISKIDYDSTKTKHKPCSRIDLGLMYVHNQLWTIHSRVTSWHGNAVFVRHGKLLNKESSSEDRFGPPLCISFDHLYIFFIIDWINNHIF